MLHSAPQPGPEDRGNIPVSDAFDNMSTPELRSTSPIIEIRESTTTNSTTPTKHEQSRFILRCTEMLKERNTSLKDLVSLTHDALDFQTRLEGDNAQGVKGILTTLDSRLEWYRQADRVLSEGVPIIASLYQQPPLTVIETMVADFLVRLRSQVPQLLEPQPRPVSQAASSRTG